jgi:hypothetical protein
MRHSCIKDDYLYLFICVNTQYNCFKIIFILDLSNASLKSLAIRRFKFNFWRNVVSKKIRTTRHIIFPINKICWTKQRNNFLNNFKVRYRKEWLNINLFCLLFYGRHELEKPPFYAVIVTCTYILNLFLFGLWGCWHCGHSWPIVPASGDSEDDCGEADGMEIGRGNRSSRRKPAPATLLSITNSHITRPGSEPRPPRWEAGD